MSKDKIQLLSPLFLKYQADFEKNPRSRVFAPLAETYRKLGMTDKAMEILAQGIRFHPTYVMGYLGLAFCYFDLKQYTLAYSTLRPLVETSRDNIRLQKLFADVCLELGYKEEALDTFKYLLFISPRDKEVALQVSTLERNIENQYKPTHNPIYIPESEFRSEPRNDKNSEQLFDVSKLETKSSGEGGFDDWMALDLSRDKKIEPSSDPYEFWNLKKGDVPLDLTTEDFTSAHQEPKKELEFESKEVPKGEIHFSLEVDEEEEEAVEEKSSTEIPLVTHTLVDLYCGQGHIEKALEILEKILLLNPNDQKTINKIAEIKALMGAYGEEEAQEVEAQEIESSTVPATKPVLSVLQDDSEEDGRKNLMSIFDQQIKQVKVEEAPKAKKAPPPASKKKSDKKRIVEEKLSLFLKKIQKRALDYQARL